MADKESWPIDFGPSYTPEEMLELGVFEGRYIGAITGKPKIPARWFKKAKVLSSKDKKTFPPDASINYYGIKSRQPLSVWRKNGWVTKNSPNGWFEWYCKFYLGRRLGDITVHGKTVNEDHWQINRWRSFVARHMGQINSNCILKDKTCRPKQRQGLLQWGWNSEVDIYSEKTVVKNAKKIASLLGLKTTDPL